MGPYGMQMPGGARRGAEMNLYTGLLGLAVVALAAACIVMFFAGTKIGPEGNAFGRHADTSPGKIEIKFSK